MCVRNGVDTINDLYFNDQVSYVCKNPRTTYNF